MRNPNTSAPQSARGSQLTQRQVSQHLDACRRLTLDFFYRTLPHFWGEWLDRLEDYAERAASNIEQNSLYEYKRLLEASQSELEQQLCERLSQGFIKFQQKRLNTLTGEERFSGDMLSLVEHSDLEETIAITSITHRADDFCSGPMWALEQRLALLNDGETPEDRSNPVSPVQFCEALRRALRDLSLDTKSKIIGYKTFDKEVIGHLPDLYEDLNTYFIDQDILPNLNYTAVVDDSSGSEAGSGGAEYEQNPEGQVPTDSQGVPQRRATDRLLSGLTNQSGEKYQAGLYNAIRLLQGHMAQQPVPGQMPVAGATEPPVGSTPYHPGLAKPYTNQQLVGVLQGLQQEALNQTQALAAQSQSGATLQPQSIQAVSQQMLAQLAAEAEEEGSVDSSDMDTIDLVGLLFEYMLSDDHLPDSIKALLSYLHTPFLKMAFIDKDFFEQADHPARVLLNSLAEAGSRWVGNDGTSQYDMYSKIKTTVFKLLADFQNDVRIFAELLLDFNAYTHNLARRQDLMERRALEKVQGEEKLKEAKQRVNNEVRRRTDNRSLPSAVLLLLLQPWADHLSFVLLRYGDQSETWRKGIQVMDDLLWTLEPKTLEADKARQLDLQEQVMQILKAGLEAIGYDQAKSKKLLSAVASLQAMALRSRAPEPAPAPMRTKLENLAAQKAGESVDRREPANEEERKIVDNLKMIEFGTWFEYGDGKRVKVAWYNKRTLHYMLVDQKGRKVAMNSGLQLARDMIAGKARIIAGSTKPFFERALENIYQQLNARAAAQTEDSAHA